MAVTPEVEIPGIELEYAFSIRINFKERIRYETPAGHRVYVPADSGEIWGPRLNGIVVPRSGGDYAGVYGLNAHYMLQADDGTHIYIHNRGYLYRTDGGDVAENDPSWGGDAEFYFRIQPVFDAEKGPHDWLNRTLILGTGQRHSDPDHTIFTYYAVR